MLKLGSVIYSAVKPIFKIYMIMGCGFYFARKNVLSVDTGKNISDMIITLILPCLAFSKIVNNIDNSDIKEIGIIVLASVVLYGFGYLGSFFVSLLPFFPKGRCEGTCLSVGGFPNISDLPIAYIQTLSSGLVFSEAEGEKGVAYICIFLAVQLICQFNLGGYRLIQRDFKNFTPTDTASLSGTEGDHKFEEVKSITPSKTQTRNSVSLPPTLRPMPTIQDEQSIDSQIDPSVTSNSDELSSTSAYAEPQNPAPLVRENTSDIHRRGSIISRSNRSQTSLVSNLELRSMPSQNLRDLVKYYSHAEEDATGPMERPPVDAESNQPASKSTWHQFLHGFKKFLFELIDNCRRPASIGIIAAIIISMIPWVRALFVLNDQAFVDNAPDQLPPLSFVMDFVNYIADACVPLGLLMLGATIARLQFNGLPKGLWKVPLLLTILRLIILPILGVLVLTKWQHNGWFDDNKILEFVCAINFGLPPATSLIYLCAFYTPPGYPHTIQVDILALCYIFHYSAIVISLPFLTTYVLKVSLKL
ncbi:hypothetical protein PP7435_CHR4-0834 [Komagataella phaffii CBS 7435]|uniref:Uncharacterized protein n=2 Tax=Komagataella phaffii TaxID=460519 RepID=C4R728_KOMPG|nr:Non-essential protein of unknown function [Komagataella phaffii GS115]AOA64448.1 GQ67_04492T0 [Komagataella phaffii]CAH2451228.1 hypothetical protein BQ9382_C4-4380 [Komagataella phaffii CBS 7435]AOA70181.1 GQ68_04464T0 [Komagataella phaffii GS115]CAY71403.1 Non-essential protein of unknown function [Komagataella phaffii GS115]SCV12415.1 hypothetical protein PP7435_CHR4-0834 [Komagataella phaffii CBS 7435]